MKKYIIIAGFVLAQIGIVSGQTPFDAFNYSRYNVGGTARYMGMSGAFGALGGDFSSLSMNPAGVGVYRTSEFVFTPGLYFSNNETNTLGTQVNDQSSSINLGNVGYVGTWRSTRSNGLVSLSWGIGMNRLQDFNRNSTYRTYGNGYSSLTDAMAREVPAGITPDDFSKSSIWNRTSWRSVLAWDTYLIDGNDPYRSVLFSETSVDQDVSIQERGSINEWAFSFGGNISHMLYFGATLGVQSVYYTKNTRFQEYFISAFDDGTTSIFPDPENDGTIYNVGGDFIHNEMLKTMGTGVNFKAGVIFRPIGLLRLGIAAHTPTMYNLTDYYDQNMDVYFPSGIDEDGNAVGEYSGFSQPDKPGKYNYKLRTPLKVMGSAALVFGKVGLLSFDYEMTDYTMMSFSNNSGGTYEFSYENEDIKNIYRISHGLRAGAELQLSRFFKLRGGAGYYTSPIAENTEDFLGDKYGDLMTFSGGVGFRTQSFFMDFSYMYKAQDFDHYLYNYQNASDGFYDIKATNQEVDHLVNVTIGFKF